MIHKLQTIHWNDIPTARPPPKGKMSPDTFGRRETPENFEGDNFGWPGPLTTWHTPGTTFQGDYYHQKKHN